MLKKILNLIVLCAVLVAIGRFWYELKGGFSPRRLIGFFPPARSQDPELPLLAKGALEQKFRYLGRGRQIYAFLSEDRNFVLKIPRLDRGQSAFPSANRKIASKKSKRSADRLKQLSQSFLVADEQLRDQSQLVFCHLSQTPIFLPKTSLCDRFGFRIPIDVGRLPFVLQKKMNSWFLEFQRVTERGDQNKQKKLLNGYLKWCLFISKLGLIDKDPFFEPNLGVLGETVCQIDVGTIFRFENLDSQEAVFRLFEQQSKKILPVIRKLAPDLETFFQQKIQELNKLQITGDLSENFLLD